MSLLPPANFPSFHSLFWAFGGNASALMDFLLEIQFQWDFFIILQSLRAGNMHLRAARKLSRSSSNFSTMDIPTYAWVSFDQKAASAA